MLAVRNIRSWIALVMPMTLVGLHALSVEIATTVSIFSCNSLIARTMFSAPSMFVRTASYGKYSHAGTCLSAAALNTMSMLVSAWAIEWKSRTSPILNWSFRSKLWYITSSVTDRRLRYSMRISCCLASSRLNTTTLCGVPIWPDRMRRVSTLPKEPVPPVIKTRLLSRYMDDWLSRGAVG